MRKDEIGESYRWRNVLVIFKGPAAPELAIVTRADSFCVCLKTASDRNLRITWAAVQMRPLAELCSPCTWVDPAEISVEHIFGARPSVLAEANAMARFIGPRWTKQSAQASA